MKIGIRTPSLKRSKARYENCLGKLDTAFSTGKLTRSIKAAVNPIYGKPGVGLIANPKRAVSNKIYKKTSFSIFDLFKKK